MSLTKHSHRARTFVSLLLVSFVSLVGAAASATVMLYADLARLVELSDTIVQGRVVDQHTFLDPKTRQVTTETTVEVDHVFFGEPVETVTISQWGGEYDDKLSRIPGDALFDPYEEAVLFLVEGKDQWAGRSYLTALGQSKYTMLRSNGEISVFRNLGDLAFMDVATNEIEPRRSEIYEYRTFVAELEALIAGIKGADAPGGAQ